MTAIRTISSLRALALTALLLCVGAITAAQASAVPAPSWEPLAASGPTNLAPVQSEIQRVAVDATGGNYTLTHTSASGTGRLSFASALGNLTSGNPTVSIVFSLGGAFAEGQTITGGSIPGGTTIVSCSPNCPTATSLTLTAAPTVTQSFIDIRASSRVVTGVSMSSGVFAVGNGVAGTGIPAGTRIAAVDTIARTLTLDQSPTQSGTQTLSVVETTTAIPFDAEASAVEAALDALPSLEVTVSGGPGNSGSTSPYNVAFDGGGLENTNVPQLSANGAGLTGGIHSRAFIYTPLQGGPGTGDLVIYAQNVGGATSTGTTTIDFTLPAGVVATGGAAVPGLGSEAVWTCDGGAGAIAMSCDKVATAPQAGPGLTLLPLIVPVRSTPGASGGDVEIEVTGGGALGTATYDMPLEVSTLDAPPGLQSYTAGAYKEDGTFDDRAGAHPFSASAAFLVNSVRSRAGGVVPAGELRDIIVDTPPGFVGNPLATEQCPEALEQPECPFASGVGTAQIYLDTLGHLPNFDLVNNIQAPVGYPAKFRFKTGADQIVVNVPATVRSDEDYGVSAGPRDTPQIKLVLGSFFTFWGTPADPAHDGQRCKGGHLEPPCGPGGENIAFLTNPVDCSVPAETGLDPVARLNFLSWQYPGQPFNANVTLPPVRECDQLDNFRAPDVDLDARPTTNVADSPTGLDVDLRIPQDNINDPLDRVTPYLRHTTVELPPGLVINPSGANGLDGCSSTEIGLRGTNFAGPHSTRFTKVPARCPDASKVGVVEVETPVIDHPLPGTVYVADPFDNPFRSLLAIYLEIDDPQTGIVAKLAGSVELDPRTGQITSTFLNNPQVPLSEFRLDFKGGAHAPLTTPPACGTYQTRSTLTPWSAPDSGPPVESIDTYQISQGPSGACASSPASLPNSPDLSAGTSSAIAGAYAPFVLNLSRADGTQRFKDITVKPPLGLVAKLAGVPYCPEAALAAAENRDGVAEQASPSCPAASKLGDVYARAGAGPDPYNAPGTAYLAGPYKGAPLSMAILTPAVAGPFDLGVVVIRTALHVNPATAEITAVSDPLPELLEGIPLNIRSASVRLNRAEFTKNPTSCDPMSVSGQLVSTLGNTVQLADRFQVGECARLGFGPNLVLRLKGGTKRGRYPQLTATMVPRPGDANIRSVSVAFPRSEFLANEHIRTICTRPDFAADNCPSGSIYGVSTVTTPLLDYPLTGNVHLRSSSNLLPDVVPDLRGPASQPIRVEAAGRTDSIRGGIRNTFDFLPDAPFTQAVLRMQGGNKGLLVNSRDICRRAYRALVRFTAHNGMTHTIKPKLIAQGCRGRKRGKR